MKVPANLAKSETEKEEIDKKCALEQTFNAVEH